MPLARPSALTLTPFVFAAVIADATACSSTETTGSGGGASTSTGSMPPLRE